VEEKKRKIKRKRMFCKEQESETEEKRG